MGVRTPDLGRVMYRVGRYGEHGAGREIVTKNTDAGTWGYDAGEAEGGGTVNAQGLGDDGVQTAGKGLALAV